MDKNLDILIQKYLAGELSPDESALVDDLKEGGEWKSAVENYVSLDHDLKKMAFLENQRAHLSQIKVEDSSKKKSYRWLILSGLAATLLVLVYMSVNYEDKKTGDTMAKNSSHKIVQDKAQEAQGTKVEAQEAEDVDEIYDFKDEDIVNDESVYNFKSENAAYESLLNKVDSANTGVMSLISKEGSNDSTYVFSQEFNNSAIQKSVSYVGATGLYAIFNVISKDERTGNVQRSIMLFDRQMNYKARYVVKSVDELAKSVSSRGFVIDIYKEDGTITKVAYELPKELECLDFPLWYTVCPAYY